MDSLITNLISGQNNVILVAFKNPAGSGSNIIIHDYESSVVVDYNSFGFNGYHLFLEAIVDIRIYSFNHSAARSF